MAGHVDQGAWQLQEAQRLPFQCGTVSWSDQQYLEFRDGLPSAAELLLQLRLGIERC